MDKEEINKRLENAPNPSIKVEYRFSGSPDIRILEIDIFKEGYILWDELLELFFKWLHKLVKINEDERLIIERIDTGKTFDENNEIIKMTKMLKNNTNYDDE